MKKCLFAGSFDPVTNGHIAVIETAAELFDEVYVAVMVNRSKNARFTLETRLKAIEAACEDFKNVKVLSYEGFLVDLMKRENIKYDVRGIRNAVDYEYETAMHEVNTSLCRGITTVYLPCAENMRHVSSSLVRELVFYGKDFSAFVPEKAAEILKKEIIK